MGGKFGLALPRFSDRNVAGSRMGLATAVRANGKFARGWRKRRVLTVLGKRDRAEKAAVLAKWDALLALRGPKE